METLFKLLNRTGTTIFVEVMSLIKCMLFNANKNVQVSLKSKVEFDICIRYIDVWFSFMCQSCMNLLLFNLQDESLKYFVSTKEEVFFMMVKKHVFALLQHDQRKVYSVSKN